MNSKGIIALKDTKVCMKCLKKKATHKYVISGRGYGRNYDNFNTYFQLCDDCHSDEYNTLVDECPDMDDYVEEYKYEKNLIEFIDSLPLESQELFHNRFACCNMKPQDWIDFELDELPHKECKKYGMYSPQERQAYKERFPNCEKVYLKTYKDGSGGCRCDFGAHGEKDGSCDKYNCWSSCYMCTNYKPRTSEMKIVDEKAEYYKNEKYRLIHMLQYASTRLRELEDNLEKYIDVHSN